MVETIYGCKWSLTVYRLLSSGVNRPGEMVRSVEGLTTKVLNECLRKNLDFGIIDRVAYPEVPPRVDYKLTPLGESLGESVCGVWMWVGEHMPDVERARPKDLAELEPIAALLGRRAHLDERDVAHDVRLVRDVLDAEDVHELVEVRLDAARLVVVGFDHPRLLHHVI